MDVQMKLSEAELEELVRSFQQDQYGNQDHSMLGVAHSYWQGWRWQRSQWVGPLSGQARFYLT